MNNKSNLININQNNQEKNLNSPNTKKNINSKTNDKSGNISNGNSKGINIIPLKTLQDSNDKNFQNNVTKNTSNTNQPNLNNLSPRLNTANISSKLASTTKHSNENKIKFDVKFQHKSPSPNRVTNTNSTKYLKKSPEIKK